MSKVIFIMGVSGSGKTHIGKRLSNILNLDFIDADDYHSSDNLEKMSKGIPLTDRDRFPWLDTLNQLAKSYDEVGCVIGCSALKQIYRIRLAHGIEKNVVWVYLKGSFDLIYQRMKTRNNHFMKPDMLQSQFDTLEEPVDAIEIDVAEASEVIIEKINLKLR